MEAEDGLNPVFDAAAELAERHLLGCLMNDNDAWWEAAKELNPSDFMGYIHCRIYLAMEELMCIGSPFDVVSMAEYLEGDERYQEAGGLRLIAEMAAGTPTRRLQVPVLARVIHAYGQLRSFAGPPQQRRIVCSLLAAKANGWFHGRSWIVTVEDIARSGRKIPGELLGQRVCYVYGEKAVALLSE
ncbi:hypothetical protein N0002_07140 [Pseudomonas aeruginosa]|uniref:DNA helicase DnaB-like N-terminal domain-containing protein n=1 Tax=Pseudomonas aeruginosa TaxID=287 RepID=A0A7M3A2A9_PSEAI|nr:MULTISPECIES: DnaB-like helicase N-terminal domain-containing protein [Pseudomonas]HCL2588101.1 hypothetical protein [Pseudomonas aeruginosa C40A]ALZ19825.1 hypothetical protein HV97_14315 [Pseudomonas aeruginosa]AYW72315.1 hypothetical protein EGV95_13230 [Pseudomonas aeruginosa]EIU7194048.1 hypothetical protein [Pseudomonas aeruginosa]EKU0637948.1 hypothetical protein [Pseudomonas aeruginosa]